MGIEKMVNEAEKYKAEDEKQRERISAKNGLESYCFNMKSTMDEEKVKSAISDSDKKKIEDKCDECIKWLDANQMAEKDEYEDKQKEVEALVVECQEVCLVACLEVCLVALELEDPLPL